MEKTIMKNGGTRVKRTNLTLYNPLAYGNPRPFHLFFQTLREKQVIRIYYHFKRKRYVVE